MKLKPSLECERNVAFESPDHLMPWGTRRDNSKNSLFNRKLYDLYIQKKSTKKGYKNKGEFISVLDLGCAGGGFVKTLIDDGHFAIGLEGSDFSKNHKRAEWGSIPDFLFTCDVTKKFQLFLGKKPAKFDVITSWELMEHIAEKDLPMVAENVKKHLKEGGLWIMSVANWHDEVNGVDLHQTVKPKKWWVNFFKKEGFENLPEYIKYFETQFVRGKCENEKDFHIILTNNRKKVPLFPEKSLKEKIFWGFVNRWVGSKPQKVLRVLMKEN